MPSQKIMPAHGSCVGGAARILQEPAHLVWIHMSRPPSNCTLPTSFLVQENSLCQSLSPPFRQFT